MNCKSCGTPNESGNKYCKECGKRLHDASHGPTPTADEHLRVGELIYTAYKESEAGRIEEAILACQGAVALNEDSASAHSLLGSLYERKGDVASAIREYEKVVALNPDGLADQRKLEALRAGIVSAPRTPSTLRKVQFGKIRPIAPYAAAAAGFILVVLLAIPFMKSELGRSSGSAGKRSEDQTQAARRPGGGAIPSRPFAPGGYRREGPSGQYYEPGYPRRSSAEDRQTSTDQPAPAPAESRNGKSGSPGTDAAKPGIPAVPLPGSAARPPPSAVNEHPQVEDKGEEPPVIVPVIEPSDVDGSASRTPTDMRAAPSPPVVRPPGQARSEAPGITPARSEPTIDPEERAMRLQRMGNYQEAINTYREALNQTSDSARVYQQMARCYQRLGQHDLAIDSYSRAIRSYRDQLVAGRDESEVRRSIRSCEAGIEVSRNQKLSEQQ